MKNVQAVAISPFVYRQYIVSSDDNFKEATLGRMCSMQKEHKLLKVHLDILKLFLKFKYLTRYQIEMALHFNDIVLPDQTTVTIKQALKYMNKNGIVKRYYFKIETPTNQKEGESAPCDDTTSSDTTSPEEDSDNDDVDIDTINEVISRRSVNFYTLTKGSLAYVMSEFRNIQTNLQEEEMIKLDSVEDILRNLSIVNFILVNTNLSKDSANFIPHCNYSSGNKQINIDCVANCVVPTSDKRVKDNIFSVFSIRKTKNWGKEFIRQLILYTDIFESKLVMKERNSIPSVLFICEDDEQIINCYREISSQKRAFNFNIFYTTDTRLNNDYLNLYIIHTEWSEENKCLLCKELLSPFYQE